MPSEAQAGAADGLLWPQWDADARVGAVMSTRAGGVSAAPWDSLNLGLAVGDDPDAVAENRRRFVHQLGARPVWLRQVHGTTVLRATAALADAAPQVADAAWTDEPGVACIVQVADCLPVLLAAPGGRAVAAAHAGWRGLADGVIEATVRAMERPAADLLAWLGPAIGPTAFEVGDEVRAAFMAVDPAADRAFVAKADGKWRADLYALARQRLADLGVDAVFGGQWCTWSAPDLFYSYRRDGRTGRMGSFIWIEGV